MIYYIFVYDLVSVMVKVYVMESCPDCVEVKARYKDDPGYELVDIGRQARSLKEFLVLRDNHPAFVKVRERGNIGIPCFVKEDGSVVISLKHYDTSLAEVNGEDGRHAEVQVPTEVSEYAAGSACNLDGTGC